MNKPLKDGPMVTRTGVFDCQVCVPEDWTDEQASEYVAMANPCGTSMGWCLRKQDAYKAPGSSDQNERQPCEERDNYVHITFDA